MTTSPDADLLAGRDRRGRRPYASPVLLRFLPGASLLVGLAAALYGVAYAVNGATRAGAPVAVFVRISDVGRLQIRQATSARRGADLAEDADGLV